MKPLLERRIPGRMPGRIAWAVVLAAVLAGGLFRCRPARSENVYGFLGHLHETGSYPQTPRAKIGHRRLVVAWEGRDSLLQRPDSSVQFRNVSLGPGAKLRFGVGVDQSCWSAEGGGVLFELDCRIGQSEKTLFSRRVDPKNKHEDRRWHDVEIDLGRFEGRVASFVFRTTTEGGRDVMPGWSDPVIVSRANKREVPASRGTNVLLITADTLRADHLGCYGSPYVKTPCLDRLAREGVLFENHFANSNVTNPSHATILTSLYAKDHNVYDNTTRLSPDVTRLPEILRARGFRTAAFTSVHLMNPPVSGFDQGFDDFSFSPYIERAAALTNREVFSWLDEHADEPFFLWVHYFDPHASYTPGRPYHAMYDSRVRKLPHERERIEGFREREALADNLMEEFALLSEGRAGGDLAARWARWAENGEFMALLMSNHPPPLPRGKDATTEAFAAWWRENLFLLRDGKGPDPSFGDWLRELSSSVDREMSLDNNLRAPWLKGVTDYTKPLALYAGEVSYLDEHIGRLIGRLKADRLYDRTVIVFTADHGESLGEHGLFFIHRSIYEGTLHVPLIVKAPSLKPKQRRVARLTNHVDILPTILDLLSLPIPEGARGQSLVPLARGNAEGFEERTIYAEHWGGFARSVRTPRFKLIKDMVTRDTASFFLGRPSFLSGRRFLFDLSRDPGERRDISLNAPGVADRLDSALELWMSDDSFAVPAAGRSKDRALIEALRTLGYIH